MFEATLERKDGGHELVAGNQRLALDEKTLAARPALRAYEGRMLIVGLRPENLEDVAFADEAPDGRRLRGKVELTEALGSELVVHFEIDAHPALTEDVQELVLDVGREFEESEHTMVVGRFNPHSGVSAGDTVEAVIDPDSYHFFDPETGAGIYDAPPDATPKGAPQ